MSAYLLSLAFKVLFIILKNYQIIGQDTFNDTFSYLVYPDDKHFFS